MLCFLIHAWIACNAIQKSRESLRLRVSRVSFCSASASAKKCHFGASLNTGIKVYSFGINTYCLQKRSKLKYLNTCCVEDNLFKKYVNSGDSNSEGSLYEVRH